MMNRSRPSMAFAIQAFSTENAKPSVVFALRWLAKHRTCNGRRVHDVRKPDAKLLLLGSQGQRLKNYISKVIDNFNI